jgi:hypothetical protein
MSALYEDDAVMAEAIRSSSLGTSEIVAATLAAGYRKLRTITTAEELDALARGTVVTSPNWMDAFSRNEWKWGLTNVATGHKQQLASLPDFLPAHVIYEAEWSK